MKNKTIMAETILKAEFYDVDSMKVVYHGNYINYYEQVRCLLLEQIGYGYREMENSGYAWPVVSVNAKYMRPIVFGQQFRISAELLEYENRIKVKFMIRDIETGALLHKGTTVQMAVDMKTGETLFVSPDCFIDLVEKYREGL